MNASTLSVQTYRPEFRSDFERLNRAWLESHALLEAADLVYLEDPEGQIVAKGGQIFFALDGNEVTGTCAAIPVSASVMELAKLAVTPAAQGRGVGRRLTLAVLEYARAAGARDVVLTSNTLLTSAIHLYESLGFRHAEMPADVRYETADVYMTLSL
ncbi:MAG: GNAT family N-acetyltransferase [Gemmatimonadaceae bacterium]|nr:GNAT family N-acetyltransferase [Gemmatimonadaceae bacterium]